MQKFSGEGAQPTRPPVPLSDGLDTRPCKILHPPRDFSRVLVVSIGLAIKTLRIRLLSVMELAQVQYN